MSLTVVVPYRPRESFDSFPDLARVIASLDCEHIVSIYGDMDERLDNYNHVHTPSSGPWNRSRALNLGIDKVKTEFVFTNDADCIWDGSFVKDQILTELKKGNHVIYRVSFGGKINPHGSGMQGYRKDTDLKWDEQYEVYGREDIDMEMQARKKGYKIVELAGGISHLNHPREDSKNMVEWSKNKSKFNKKWNV